MDNERMERLLSFMKEEAYKPLTVKELEEAFNIQGSHEFKEFVKMLVHMEEQGYILRTRNNRYGLPEKMNFMRGKVIGNARGFAFVEVEEEGHSDIFIPASELKSAMHGDIVLVRLSSKSSGARPEGTIEKIIERGIKEIVGTYSDSKHFGFVISDNKKIQNDIFIPKAVSHGAVEGHKVVVKITKYPEGKMSAEGEVIKILGHKNDPGVDILSIIYKHGLPREFPEDVIAQANAAPEEVPEEAMEGRRDLREETIVTIDGADAKDLDDAISIGRLENGNYKLGVHIADVTHYVEEGSPIDQEALERGTSVYLVDRVIPMIPHRLSNGICSLNPQVNRLTLSCEMEIDSSGEVVSHEIFPSVIRTTERMTYNDVRAILVDEDSALIERYEPLVPMFRLMEELAEVLRSKRMRRGAIDFDFKEAKVIVDEDSNPTDVVIRERSVAERLIEEFMLCANETVAEHFHWLKVPFIYRIHEDPKEEKLQRFLDFVTNFGYVIKGKSNEIHPRSLQQIIDQVSGEPEEMVINKVMLRSMQQAKYDPESLGHFGLATEFYTHFTSPIRRYPDLIVHRLIRTYLFEGKMSDDVQSYWKAQLPEIARHTSQMERRSVDAERETDDLKKAQFMEDKVGEEFDGIISSVTNFGMFIELPNTIEGLIHVTELTDDYYNYDERNYAMIGERTGNVFRIGDEISIRVTNVNVEERAIDFEVVGMKGSNRKKKVDQPTVIQSRKRNDEKSGSRRRKRSTSGEGSGRKRTTENSSGSSNNKDKKEPFYKAPSKKKKRRRNQ